MANEMDQLEVGMLLKRAGATEEKSQEKKWHHLRHPKTTMTMTTLMIHRKPKKISLRTIFQKKISNNNRPGF